jgi:hypothetical protein
MKSNFKHIKNETILALLLELANEGTCWLAYDHFNDFTIKKLNELQPELPALHHDTDNPVWEELDYEYIDLVTMLPAMRIACANTLYLCSHCGKITTEAFDCDFEGYRFIDLTSEGDLYN